MTPIHGSSNIAAVGYDPHTNMLSVQFHSGATHTYANVPKRHYDKLLKAKSAGGYFHAHIRNVYEAKKREEAK